MLAGATRIIEICFFASSADPAPSDDNDSASDHTVGGPAHRPETLNAAGKAFRHLPPFVRLSYSHKSGVNCPSVASSCRVSTVRHCMTSD